MQHEVRSIPPAPRRVRMQPLLAHRWPLLACGTAMIVVGALIAWAMFLQSGGKFSMGPLLDAGPTEIAQGTVVRVLPATEFDDRRWNDVRYKFIWDRSNLYGGSFLPADQLEVGDEVTVELLQSDPNTNRIVGGRLHSDRRWLYARFWIVILMVPGALILLAWLTAVFQLRLVLVHGDVSVARVTEVQTARFVLPEMLWVSYEFRDHRAQMRKNRHWVRARGALGTRLQKHASIERNEALPVLHDRRMPHWNRLLLPQDFLETPPTTLPQDLTTGD